MLRSRVNACSLAPRFSSWVSAAHCAVGGKKKKKNEDNETEEAKLGPLGSSDRISIMDILVDRFEDE